jgi:two-component system nitrate/nitrite response regulator NarL
VIRLVLADDHPMLLEGLTASLTALGDFEVLDVAHDGLAALHAIRRARPRVALVDVHLPRRTGLDVCRALRSEGMPTRVVLMTSFDDEATYRAALEAGASGFLGKASRVDRVAEALRTVASGETFFASASSVRAAGPPAAPASGRDNPLTPREREVLRLVATGLSTPEIAARLGTARSTVKNQTASILRKLGVSDRTRAALVALRDGWI